MSTALLELGGGGGFQGPASPSWTCLYLLMPPVPSFQESAPSFLHRGFGHVAWTQGPESVTATRVREEGGTESALEMRRGRFTGSDRLSSKTFTETPSKQQ